MSMLLYICGHLEQLVFRWNEFNTRRSIFMGIINMALGSKASTNPSPLPIPLLSSLSLNDCFNFHNALCGTLLVLFWTFDMFEWGKNRTFIKFYSNCHKKDMIIKIESCGKKLVETGNKYLFALKYINLNYTCKLIFNFSPDQIDRIWKDYKVFKATGLVSFHLSGSGGGQVVKPRPWGIKG